MLLRALYFLALLTAALALVPTGAHLAELGHKLRMNSEDYLAVQQIYRGWSWFGIVVIAALATTLALSVAVRRWRRAFRMALVAFLCIAGTQVIFWTWTFPANQATDNWTILPPNWMDLRREWEYSHAASAVLNLAAVVALIMSVLLGPVGPDSARKSPAAGRLRIAGDARPHPERPLTVAVVGAGTAVGVGIGALLGVAIEDTPLAMGLGIPLGLAVAIGIHELRGRRRIH